MTEKLAKREGFGDILADGVKRAAEKIGKGADKYAIHIHGQEVPAHNPVAGPSMIITYTTNASPARHTQGSERYHLKGLLPEFNQQSDSERIRSYVRGSNFQHSLMCSGTCLFVYMALPRVDAIAEFMSAVTGWDITTDELVETGERIANIRQAFNIREGINPLNYEVSNRILGRPPQKIGPLAGVTVDADTLVNDYLAAMDWDLTTAKPSEKKLKELGLEDIARELW
jgi:aldehyde:ferredoxin oxidoreductase